MRNEERGVWRPILREGKVPFFVPKRHLSKAVRKILEAVAPQNALNGFYSLTVISYCCC